MAAVAYVLLPITGLIAYLWGKDARVRFHGLQAISLGLLWPAALYAASAFSRTATQIVFVVGAAVWLLLFITAAAGRGFRMPGLSGVLQRWAEPAPLEDGS